MNDEASKPSAALARKSMLALRTVDRFAIPLVVALVVGYSTFKLAQPRDPSVAVDEGVLLIAGDRSWPVDSSRATLFVFSDYQCRYCRELELNLAALAPDIRSRVSVAIRHAPFIDPTSLAAAIAMECAEDFGAGEQAHRWLFDNQDSIARHPWGRMIAAVAPSDSSSIEGCIATARTQNRVRADVVVARKLGISGTPTIVLDGRTYIGAISVSQLETIILRASPIAD